MYIFLEYFISTSSINTVTWQYITFIYRLMIKRTHRSLTRPGHVLQLDLMFYSVVYYKKRHSRNLQLTMPMVTM